MYIQRLIIILSVIFLKLESAQVVPGDTTPDSHCVFRRTGCISAPDGAISETDNLIRFKESMFAGFGTPGMRVRTLAPETPQITELSAIASWPKELIYCQCNLGSCAANAMAFCIRYLSVRNSRDPSNFLANPERLDPSRLYIYYNTRFLEGAAWKTNSTESDTGASIAGTILAVDKYGCCPEVFIDDPAKPTNIFDYKGWGYDTRKFAEQPSPESYRFAYDPSFCGLNTCKALTTGSEGKNPYQYVSKYVQYTDIFSKYTKLGWLDTVKKQELVKECVTMLAKNTPILYGFGLDRSYEQHCNGFIPMPSIATFAPTSGHAVVIVGYGNYNRTEPSKNYFKFVNSWGPSWGNGGYGYLPEEYVTNPNVFSRGGYAIHLPRVTTVAATMPPKCCSAAGELPTPGAIVRAEMVEEDLSKKEATAISKDDEQQRDT